MVHEHRFLRSNHIIGLVGESAQPILRRLQLLFHHGYLTRPRVQIEYFGKGGSKALAYGLGNKGAKALREGGVNVRGVRWNEKNQTIKRVFLDHALAVSDFIVSIQLACRRSQAVGYIPQQALLQTCSRSSFRWRVNAEGVRLGVVPDRVFALNSNNSERTTFFVEIDRGTMPVIRKNFDRTSMYRKLVAYHATWKQRIHPREFGIDRIRVLVVSKSKARMLNLIEVCAKLSGGRRLFLFSHVEATDADPLSLEWRDGNDEPAVLRA